MATSLRPPAGEPADSTRRPTAWLVPTFATGILFGIALTKADAVSWFRLQEMFRFHSFHLYGVFLTTIAVAAPTIHLLQRYGRTLSGDPIVVPPKVLGRGTRYWAGGSIFGVGLALTGACPGPLFALIGAGVTVMAVVVASALAGAWLYGYLRPRLPHY
jgi:uncharacterized protein